MLHLLTQPVAFRMFTPPVRLLYAASTSWALTPCLRPFADFVYVTCFQPLTFTDG